MFRILDLQIKDRYFADGATFDTKEDVRLQLIDFHSEGMEEEDIPELEGMKLDEILSCFDWILEECEESKECE